MAREGERTLLDALVNGSPEALIAMSPAGHVLFWSRGAESLYGFDRGECERRLMHDLVIPPDRLQEFREMLDETLRSGHASRESWRRRKDGTLLPVDVLMNLCRDGGEEFVVASERDISIRTRAYEALRKLSSIVQYSDDAIISETLEGTILSWNAGATRLYGYAPEEVIGRSITILAPSDRADEPLELLSRIRRGERVEHYHTVRTRKDGESIEISAKISPILDADGHITGASLIARDVTEEKRLRRELDRIERQRAEDLRRFVSSVQKAQEEERRRISRELHDDLGQRLTGLKLRVEVLEDEIPGTSPRVTGAIRRITGDIEAMIADIKRISTNLRPAELDDFGLVSALNLLCRDFQKTGGVSVAFHPGPAVEYGKDVEIALYRIAQEALANVARHSGARAVAVRLSSGDGVVGLVIEDDGCGFDAPAAGAQPGPRRGLGLIGMKERAQLFGGSLYLTSAPGRGTRIHVEIPLETKGS